MKDLRRYHLFATSLAMSIASALAVGSSFYFARTRPALAIENSTVNPPPFVVEGWMKPHVDFWIKIYSEISNQDAVIHDAEYLDKIYEVCKPRNCPARIRHWQSVLRRIDARQLELKPKSDALSADERKLLDLYADETDPKKFKLAAQAGRLRFQRGQRERFRTSLMESGRYLKAMEEIFAKEKIPPPLTRIPFIESSFQLHAKSHLGAVGVWQFMRPTALKFMRIDTLTDEREDPITSSKAAARLLGENYSILQSWPLAIIAYNHGATGMLRASKKLNTQDFRLIWKHYLSPSFGFASRNYYFEFLAALQIEKNVPAYFGRIDRGPPIKFSEVLLIDPIKIPQLLHFYSIDPDEFHLQNRGLREDVLEGKKSLPSGFKIRVPLDASHFYRRYKEFRRTI